MKGVCSWGHLLCSIGKDEPFSDDAQVDESLDVPAEEDIIDADRQEDVAAAVRVTKIASIPQAEQNH